jgi:hypothetical protein
MEISRENINYTYLSIVLQSVAAQYSPYATFVIQFAERRELPPVIKLVFNK